MQYVHYYKVSNNHPNIYLHPPCFCVYDAEVSKSCFKFLSFACSPFWILHLFCLAGFAAFSQVNDKHIISKGSFVFVFSARKHIVVIILKPHLEKYVEYICGLTWTLFHHCHLFLLFLLVSISVQPQFGLSNLLGIWISVSFTFISLNQTHDTQIIHSHLISVQLQLMGDQIKYKEQGNMVLSLTITQVEQTFTKKVLSMRLSSFFVDSQRSHRNMYTSSVSTSSTSTWSRYQSAPIMELS